MLRTPHRRWRNALLVTCVVFGLAWCVFMMASGANASDAAVRTIMALLGIPRQDGSAAAPDAGLRAWEVSVWFAGLLLRLYLLALLLAGMVRRQIEREVKKEVTQWQVQRRASETAARPGQGIFSRSAWN